MAAPKKATSTATTAPAKSRAVPEQTGPTMAVTVVGPSHVTHHGQLYRAGDTVHLPEEIAMTLVESGAVTKTAT